MGKKRWLLAGIAVALLGTAFALALRGMNRMVIIRATPKQVAKITGSDLDWKPWKADNSVSRSVLEEAVKPDLVALTRYTNVAGLVQKKREIRATWPVVSAAIGKLKGKVLQPPE